MDIRRKNFVADASERLAFLLDEHGFAGPEVEQHGEYPVVLRLRYHRMDVDVEETLVLSYAGEEYVSADLVFTDQTSGARTRAPISTDTAHTGYQMDQAIDRHAREVREELTANGALSDKG